MARTRLRDDRVYPRSGRELVHRGNRRKPAPGARHAARAGRAAGRAACSHRRPAAPPPARRRAGPAPPRSGRPGTGRRRRGPAWHRPARPRPCHRRRAVTISRVSPSCRKIHGRRWPLLGTSNWMAFVRRQVVRRGRGAVLAQVGGRGHHHHLGVFQLAGDQRGVAGRPAAHGEVEGVIGKAHVAPLSADPERPPREAARKAGSTGSTR